jgi:hypothetical protein
VKKMSHRPRQEAALHNNSCHHLVAAPSEQIRATKADNRTKVVLLYNLTHSGLQYSTLSYLHMHAGSGGGRTMPILQNKICWRHKTKPNVRHDPIQARSDHIRIHTAIDQIFYRQPLIPISYAPNGQNRGEVVEVLYTETQRRNPQVAQRWEERRFRK